MISLAKGELIIFYQDYIKIPEDGLQKFWDAYLKNPNTAFTAPVGHTDDWERVEWDWRTEREDIAWNELELDWGAVSKSALYSVGGFDERLDQWWSMDNVSLGKRLHLKGYKLKCIKDNPAIGYNHDKFIKHPFREKYNPQEVNKILNEYEHNPTLKYLI